MGKALHRRSRPRGRTMRALLRQALRRLAQGLIQVWRAHRSSLLTNATYAAAIAATAAALVTQSTVVDLLTALAAGVIAVRRALTHHQSDPGGLSRRNDSLEGDQQ